MNKNVVRKWQSFQMVLTLFNYPVKVAFLIPISMNKAGHCWKISLTNSKQQSNKKSSFLLFCEGRVEELQDPIITGATKNPPFVVNPIPPTIIPWFLQDWLGDRTFRKIPNLIRFLFCFQLIVRLDFISNLFWPISQVKLVSRINGKFGLNKNHLIKYLLQNLPIVACFDQKLNIDC